MLKHDTLKNGTSRIDLYGSAPPGNNVLDLKNFTYPGPDSKLAELILICNFLNSELDLGDLSFKTNFHLQTVCCDTVPR